MKIFTKLRRALDRITGLETFHNDIQAVHHEISGLRREVEDLKLLSAKTFINQIKNLSTCESLKEFEFKVFSQFGDDGIIQYLINGAEIDVQEFVEFGVEDYTEANTRFLLMNNNWKGLVMDGSAENIERIRKREYYWRHDLSAVQCWVDRESINNVLRENGFDGPLGLLSIDIDGNDYWIWECLDAVDPVVVIVEYNSVFGKDYAITIPYDPAFNRTRAHYSNLYWGTSLKALCMLAEKKGYAFSGTNSTGNNAYFVKKSKLGKILPRRIEENYVISKYRESRDLAGKLTFVGGEDRLKLIDDMPVYDVENNRIAKIKDL